MRNILITNDDGIESDGILRLAQTCRELGRVVIVAPMNECSAMSHRITLREHIDVVKVDFPVEGVEAYASTGTPADCVRFGLKNIMKERPDFVLSGINNGFNSGTDIQYSATVGAALEAANAGVHAIALSEGYECLHEVTDKYLRQTILDLADKKLGYDQIWNVNFPKCPLSGFKGTLYDRAVAKNSFYHDIYKEELLPDGTLRLRVSGTYYEDGEPGSDVAAIIDGYISIGVVHNLH
ncbi:MAG: 5'/3'-nucleotidase SurE [Lachnospiraceae bacterium]|nr:5'/3'-nucleotidase SurE [Lachnospiraceae bacterium]